MRGCRKSRKQQTVPIGATAFCGIAVLGAVAFLSGCDENRLLSITDDPTVVVEESGQVMYRIVGTFDKSYYDLAELEEMARQEVTEFNRSIQKDISQETVTLEKVEGISAASETVAVSYLFAGWETFEAFTGNDLFFGEVSEAVANGIPVDVLLQAVKDGETVSVEDIKASSQRKLVITDVKAKVYCPGKVTHISTGGVLAEDGSVDTLNADGLVYILLK